MLSLILLLVGFSSAQSQDNFVAVEWTTNTDGTVYLVPQSSKTTLLEEPIIGNRYPAGQDLPPPTYQPPTAPVYTPPKTPAQPPKRPAYIPPYKGKYKGLGKYSCVKQGYLNAGEGDVSNKFLAMMIVRAKDRNDNWGMTRENAERQTLREAIYSSTALGPCKGDGYRFSAQEAAQADQWLSGERINVSKAQYKAVFQIDAYKVDQVVKNYDTTPARVRRNWQYWGEGTTAQACSKPLAPKNRKRLCEMVARACNVTEVGCGRGITEFIDREGGGNDGGNNGGNSGGNDGGNSGGNDGGNNGGNTGGNDGGNNGGNTGGNDGGNDGGSTGNGETGPGSNSDSHGSDNGGGHGDGPK